MEREIIATFRAATSKPEYLTVDKLDAGLGGWGAFNLGVWAAANMIAKEIQKGKKMKLEITDEAYTDVDEIAHFLAQELKVSGYHRIGTSHVFHQVTFAKKKLAITAKGKTEAVECEIKLIGDPLAPLSVDIAHDVLVGIQWLIKEELDASSSLHELRTLIEARLREGGEISIEIT